MKTGIAMWHYPHRTTLENVEYFISKGLKTLGVNQSQLVEACLDGDGDKLAQILKSNNVSITLHGEMVCSHKEEDVADYKERMNIVGAWQKKYGLISVISFDVAQVIRDNVSGYIDYVLDNVPECSVALEDFGLTADEKEQIEYLKSNKRFGYLVDIGHMYIRLCGGNKSYNMTLMETSVEECEASEKPGFEQFLKAFKSKEFPIKEVHLHNNDGFKDMHYFLEDGTLDISIIAQVLKEINYDGVVTVESAPGYMFECKYPESDKRILENVKYWESVFR